MVPWGEVAAACRGWAATVAGSEEEVFAIAHAYSRRQLQYPEVNREVALAVMKSCEDALGVA